MFLPKIKELDKSKNKIQASGGLSEEEISKIVKEAEANKDADKKKEAVDVRSQADSIIHTTEKSLKEHGDKITSEREKGNRNSHVRLKKCFKSTDTEEVKKTQGLIQASMKLVRQFKSQQNLVESLIIKKLIKRIRERQHC